MSLYLGRRRALRNIERHLADSDRNLDELFCSFSELVRDELMPRTEKIRAGPIRLLALLGRWSDRGRAVRCASHDQRS
jgi:hypothetical protein